MILPGKYVLEMSMQGEQISILWSGKLTSGTTKVWNLQLQIGASVAKCPTAMVYKTKILPIVHMYV